MNGHATLHDLDVRLEEFRRSDAERDTVIQLDAACGRLKHVDARKIYMMPKMLHGVLLHLPLYYHRGLSLTRERQEANPFVLVLIDGDGALFHDKLYQSVDGGAEAAHGLLVAIRNHLAKLYPDVSNTSNWSIMVQYFYNMEGLSHKLRALGILKNPNAMAPFARAFSLNQPLFNFIDVGSGKERADYKVRETLRLFLPNLQCKHVVFGGCHDNGYLPALDPYKLDPSYSSRISLLETLPMQPGFAQLGFQTTKFPSIFRSEPLPERPVSMSPIMMNQENLAGKQQSVPMRTTSIGAGGAPVLPAAVQATVQAASSPSNPRTCSPSPSVDSTGSSWATVGKAQSGTKKITISSKKAANRRFILLNKNGERLDPDLPRPDPTAQQRLFERTKKQKVCNNFHLRGKCESGHYCDYDHGERLTPGEQLALKHRARTRSCPDKSACRDFNCTNGHVCPYGSVCFGDGCWFQNVHDIDLDAACRLYENGEQDSLRHH